MKVKSDKRTLNQLIEMVLFERLDSILEETKGTADNSVMDHGEDVIDSLPDDQKEAMQAYLNVLLDHESQSNEKAYLGGFHGALNTFSQIAVT